MRHAVFAVMLACVLAASACGSPRPRADDATTAPPDRAGTPAAAASLAPSASSETTPVRLANGRRRLAFVSDREGAYHLYTMSADGSDIRRLSDQAVSRMPFSVSTDGTQIAAAGPEEDGASALHLYRVDIADGATQLIGTIPPSDSDLLIPAPYWQPDDGSILALNYSICYAVPSGGGEPRERDASECTEAEMRATGPDGRWAAIVGVSVVTGRGTAPNFQERDRVIPPDARQGGAGLILLGLQVFGAWRPLWSPDGTLIAYVDADTPDGRTGLSVISANGGAPRLVVGADRNDLQVPTAWSDDGRLLYFSGFDKGSSIRAVDVQTGEVRTLAGEDGHAYLYARWVVDTPAPQRPSDTSNTNAQSDQLKAELAKAAGRLIYEGSDARRGFYSVRPDGSDERLVTNDDTYPSFTSIGGRWLSFDARDGTMVVVDTTTGEARVFGKGKTPVVSPSGKDVAYWEYDSGGGATLVRLEIATGRRTELYRGTVGYEAVEASWSPDGRRLAFFEEKPPSRPEVTADFVLTVVSADGGPLTELATMTSDLDASGPIVWSPYGSQIAFEDDIVRVVPSTGGVVRDYPVYADAVSWSPDGERLAVQGGGVLVIDVATGNTEPLTSDLGGTAGSAPAWSPDGRWLAYAGADGSLRVMEVATRVVVRLGISGDEVSWITP